MMSKNKIAQKIKRLESKAPNISSFSKKKQTKEDKRFKRIVFILVLIGGVICFGMIAYFMTQATQADLNDRTKFVQLRETVNTVHQRFTKAKTVSMPWEEVSDSCSYSVGVGLEKGGWYCSVTFGLKDIELDKGNIKSFVHTYENILKGSDDVLKFKSSQSYLNFPESLQENGNYTSFFLDKKTNIGCELSFSLPEKEDLINNEGIIKGGFSCADSARKSWYKNGGLYGSTEGADAWK